MKEFTIEQVGNIFKTETFKTLTPMKYKGANYIFQFDFEAEKKGGRIINIVKTGLPAKTVGFFKY